jgi:hypothetical protein
MLCCCFLSLPRRDVASTKPLTQNQFCLEPWRPLPTKLVLCQVLLSVSDNLGMSKQRLLEDASRLYELTAMHHCRRPKVLLETQPLVHYYKQPDGLTENSVSGCMEVFVNLPQNIKDATL